ncbi:MAG: hypothetical protein CMF11_09485 [Idiomarina sp.]|nr:hypothetical protein [Idiomarina sp.]
MNSFLSSLYGKFRTTAHQLLLETKDVLTGCFKFIKSWWKTTIVSRAVGFLTAWRSTLGLVLSSLTQCWNTIRSILENAAKK